MEHSSAMSSVLGGFRIHAGKFSSPHRTYLKVYNYVAFTQINKQTNKKTKQKLQCT